MVLAASSWQPFCNILTLNTLLVALQKVAFYVVIDGLLHCKRPSFRCQKVTFYILPAIWLACLRPRRGRIMRNRMWSVAELADNKPSVNPSPTGANLICGYENIRLLGCAAYTLSVKPHNLKLYGSICCSTSSRPKCWPFFVRKFRSLRSLHMRLRMIRPLRGL